MIPGSVFLLCAATSLLCSALLHRGYRKTRVRLLFWSALCFVGLMIDNCMLYADFHLFPDIPLGIWRTIPGLIATTLLLFGLIWNSE